MTDPIRAALAEETLATVTPPFETVVRLHRRRVATQVLGAAAAVLLVVGGVAVAVPRGVPRARLQPAAPAPSPSLRWFSEILSDPEAVAAVAACMRERGYTGKGDGFRLLGPDSYEYTSGYDECFHQQGYESPHERMPDRNAPRVCDLGAPATAGTEIARGAFDGKPWSGRVIRNADGTVCIGYTYGSRFEGILHDEPPGASSPTDPLVPGAKNGAMMFYGSVPPEATRVEVVSGGRTYTAVTVAVPGIDDRRFYTLAVPYRDGKTFDYSRTDYAADGRVVGGTTASFPLH